MLTKLEFRRLENHVIFHTQYPSSVNSSPARVTMLFYSTILEFIELKYGSGILLF